MIKFSNREVSWVKIVGIRLKMYSCICIMFIYSINDVKVFNFVIVFKSYMKLLCIMVYGYFNMSW